ncbi:MAG: DUF6754 domain-containing protein [Anaerolineales bacterium]
MTESILEVSIIGLSAFLLLVITIWKRRSPSKFREIPALARMYRAIGLSVEDGSRLHISLGSGGVLTSHGGSAFAGLETLRHITERTSASDQPPVVSTGEATLGLLAQDTLQAGYQSAGVDELYSPTSGRVTGLSPFSYAAGAMPITQNENISANILLGHFGPEVALLADASDRENVVMIGASDNISGQSILFASSQEPLIGEELFAPPAYINAGASHIASLTLQDILRWLIIIALLVGAGLKFLGLTF